MPDYNKEVARKLLDELQEHLGGTPDRIDQAPDEGPAIKLICGALGQAITALKTIV